MYRNEHEKLLERVSTAEELAKDFGNINRCESSLRNFVRENAIACLHDMLREYQNEINIIGFLVDGVHVIYGISLDHFSDTDIQTQLQYLIRHIPVYVLLREGEKELAKRICHWLDETGNTTCKRVTK